MIKMKSLLKEYKYGGVIDMKEKMKDGTFDPDNPDIHIAGWGVLPLKSLHKWISKDLKTLSDDASVISDHSMKNVEKRLFDRHAPLQHKILALNEAYKQMSSSQYKRAVTIYKKKK
tara:strand:- start:714 stop:1061 length:348 start_codon:yes stop_codon:yes gene_type:complete